ncbi:MAG: hypothetical protein WC989_05645 [Micavibrio sp.]
MDLNALTYLNNYRMSLTDYMDKGRTGHFDSIAQGLMDTVAARYGATAQIAGEAVQGDTVTLSEEAKALLAGMNGKDEAGSRMSGVQKAAQNFLIGFFDQSGIDFSSLSSEAFNIIEGLQGVIEGTGAAARDTTTDRMEMRYGENGKKVYTLAGNNTRLRIAIEYAEDKTTPVKLSITDITGPQVETAEITLKEDEDGVMRMDIERTQREYRNGYMVSLGEMEPLSMKLYAA